MREGLQDALVTIRRGQGSLKDGAYTAKDHQILDQINPYVTGWSHAIYDLFHSHCTTSRIYDHHAEPLAQTASQDQFSNVIPVDPWGTTRKHRRSEVMICVNREHLWHWNSKSPLVAIVGFVHVSWLTLGTFLPPCLEPKQLNFETARHFAAIYASSIATCDFRVRIPSL